MNVLSFSLVENVKCNIFWYGHTVLCVTLSAVSQRVLEWADVNNKYSISLALGIDTHKKINIVLIGHEKRERVLSFTR